MSDRESTKNEDSKILWDVDEMILAVKAVMENELTLTDAAFKHRVPRTTLYDKLKKLKLGDVVDLSLNKRGRKPILPKKDESSLVEYAMLGMQCGFQIKKMKKELRRLAFKFGVQNGDRDGSPKYRIASDNWLRGFLKRHPNLSFLEPVSAQTVRTSRSRRLPSRKPVATSALRENKSEKVNQTNSIANQTVKSKADKPKPLRFKKPKTLQEAFIENFLEQGAKVPKKSSKSIESSDSSKDVVLRSAVCYDQDGGKWIRSFTCVSCGTLVYEYYYDLDKMSHSYECPFCVNKMK